MRLHRSELLAATALLVLGLAAIGLRQIGVASCAPPDPVLEVTVDVNVSTQGRLTTLPGVGPATAEAIVRGRPYRSVDELRPILGEDRFARVRPWIEVKR